MKTLITGSAGFVGSHVLEYLLENTDWEIICLVKMARAGNLNRIQEILNPEFEKRVKIVRHDLLDPLDSIHRHIGEVDYIVHMAADSHVDDSINRPREVFINNADSTVNMLNYAKDHQPNLKRFLYYSTDEVYGDASNDYAFVEGDALMPRNPYSAGKASGEMACHAWRETYGVPVLIMRTMNMYGERQDPEKMIPKTIKTILAGEKMTIHKHGKELGTRHWLYAKNSADAVLFMLKGDFDVLKVNVPGEIELDNLEIAQTTARLMDMKLKHKFIQAETVRPGYDRRYSVDGTLIADLGWTPPFNFVESLEKTIKFSIENPEWVI